MSERDPAKLAALEVDWNSYGAPPISKEAIAAAEAINDALSFVPTAKGGIDIVCYAAGIEFEARIGSDGRLESVLVERAGID